MGREVRMVTPDWQHPKDASGHYIPLRDNYKDDAAEFLRIANEKGLQEAVDWWGQAPSKEEYMLPDATPEERTHLMMYEDTSEGTPISPAFATAEELARWLVDNSTSIFGLTNTADYDTWMRVIKGAFVTLGADSSTGIQVMVLGGGAHDKD